MYIHVILNGVIFSTTMSTPSVEKQQPNEADGQTLQVVKVICDKVSYLVTSKLELNRRSEFTVNLDSRVFRQIIPIIIIIIIH